MPAVPDAETAIDDALIPASDPPPWPLRVPGAGRSCARLGGECGNGLLRVTAPLAQPATKVNVQAA